MGEARLWLAAVMCSLFMIGYGLAAMGVSVGVLMAVGGLFGFAVGFLSAE